MRSRAPRLAWSLLLSPLLLAAPSFAADAPFLSAGAGTATRAAVKTGARVAVEHAGRPTGVQRSAAKPGSFDASPSRWVETPGAFRSAALAASGARLYRVTTSAKAHGAPTLVLVRGDTEYFLPQGLNAFLADAGVEADGEVITEVAELAAWALRPDEDLAFTAAERIARIGDDGEHYRLRVRARAAGGDGYEWEFGYGAGRLAGQIRVVNESVVRGGVRTQFRVVAPAQVTVGETLDLAGDIEIDAWYPGETFLRVRYNAVATGNRVRFVLDGFTPGATVHLRVRSTRAGYGPDFLEPQPVVLDGTGWGLLDWTPAGAALTGLGNVQIGTVTNPADPAGTFTPNAAWPTAVLTTERVRGILFPGGTVDSCLVHYCEQFFQVHPLGTGHTETYVDYIVNGLNDSWTNQVVNWSMAQGHVNDEPIDTDDVHHLYVNDHGQLFRGNTSGGTGSAAWASGTRRETWIRNDGFYRDVDSTAFDPQLYTSEDLRTRVAVAHEFVHGVQAGWVDAFGSDYDWVKEGQARFMESVQYEAEALLENTQHYYPRDARTFLRTQYRWPLWAQSYRGCLYWRMLYEKNRPAGATAQKLAIVRRTLQEMPGWTGSADAVIPSFMDAALAAEGVGFQNWLATRDSFLHVLWRHDWNPNSASIVVPAVTGDPDSDRVSNLYDGTPITADDGIGYRHAMDFWNFRMDRTKDLRALSLCFDADPDHDGSFAQFHLNVMLFKGASNSARVAVIPRNLAEWDSVLDVRDVDSVVVGVVRLDIPPYATPDSTYRIRLSPPLAVDLPYWDHIQDVLDTMGPRYRYAVIDEDSLRSERFPWCLYDVTFLNCSPYSPAVSTAPGVSDSMRAFVKRGGYLYISDYDYEYIKATWPAAIAWGTPTKFGLAQTITATVTDPGLVAVLGSTTTPVTFDLGAWVTVARPGPGTTVHMRGTYAVNQWIPGPFGAHPESHGMVRAPETACALAAADGATRVPTPEQAQAWLMRTGPLLLSFPDEKGRVIFTCFHNYAQASASQQKLLKYMIFRQVGGDLLAAALAALTAGYHAYEQIVNGIQPGETQSFPFDNPFSGPIEAVLNWGGSELKLTAKRPDGSVFGSVQSTTPPVKLTIPAATPGNWTFEVQAVDVPDSNYAFALVVGGPDPIPGMPAVDAAGDAPVCAGETRLVAVPVRNLALYPDSFAVHLASDLAWTVAPTDTVIRAWEGMVDSVYARVTVPGGLPYGTADSLRASVHSLTQPANRDSGARAMTFAAPSPALAIGYGTDPACPGSGALQQVILSSNARCATPFHLRFTGSRPWTITPETTTVVFTPPYGPAVSFTVSVPPGTPHGTQDTLYALAYNVGSPAERDSVEFTIAVAYAPPTVDAPAAVQALRTQEISLTYFFSNNTACNESYVITARDSLGWHVEPDSLEGIAYSGLSYLPVLVRVPPDAPLGAANPVRVSARTSSGSLGPVSGTAYVTVLTPGDVLVVDPEGAFYATPFFDAAIEAAGRTHTDWSVPGGAPDDTILAMFPRVVWSVASGYGLGAPDTSTLGSYLRGGGRLFVSGQNVLADTYVAGPLLAVYGGAVQASEGGGTGSVKGTPGTFLGAVGATDIFGGSGASDQYSPDELATTGTGFAVMEYVPAGPLPAVAGRVVHALGSDAALERFAARPVKPHRSALTTGIAAVANDPGTWRMVTFGFGFEALADSATRAGVMKKVLDFLDLGATAGVVEPAPRSLGLTVAPNPAGGPMRLALALPHASRVSLAIYDLLGRRVRVLLDGEAAAGVRTLVWDGRDGDGRAAPGGLYFARLEAAGERVTRRLVRLGR